MDPTVKPGISDLAAAYVAAWAQVDNVVKNAENPHFNSQYADLGAVLDTIRPVFGAHGLALFTAPGELDGDKVTLMWVLLHRSGQSITGKMSVPIGNKATAQATGSCITYMRRYLSAAIGGIAQVDDDGNAASAPAAPSRTPAKPAKQMNSSYAEAAVSLIERINACEDLAALETIKPEVAEVGDQVIADAYVSRKKTLKAKK